MDITQSVPEVKGRFGPEGAASSHLFAKNARGTRHRSSFAAPKLVFSTVVSLASAAYHPSAKPTKGYSVLTATAEIANSGLQNIRGKNEKNNDASFRRRSTVRCGGSVNPGLSPEREWRSEGGSLRAEYHRGFEPQDATAHQQRPPHYFCGAGYEE